MAATEEQLKAVLSTIEDARNQERLMIKLRFEDLVSEIRSALADSECEGEVWFLLTEFEKNALR